MLSISIIYSKCGREYEKKEKELIEILKIIGLINKIEEFQKYITMSEKNITQEFRLEKLEAIKQCLIKEIIQNEIMNNKHTKFCRVVSYIYHLIIVISLITGCVCIPAFASLGGIPIGITSSAIRLKISAITVGIKKYKLIIPKKKKKHDKIVLLAKSKSKSI